MLSFSSDLILHIYVKKKRYTLIFFFLTTNTLFFIENTLQFIVNHFINIFVYILL